MKGLSVRRTPKIPMRPALSLRSVPMESRNEPRQSIASRASGFASNLNAKQVRELETRLQRLKVELTAALDGRAGTFDTSHLNESLIKGDDAEVAEKQRMSNATLQEIEFIKSRLRLVERALRKLGEGVYGICEETEEPIGFERLSVVPWARFAVHVQEMRERKMRDFKVSRLRSEV